MVRQPIPSAQAQRVQDLTVFQVGLLLVGALCACAEALLIKSLTWYQGRSNLVDSPKKVIFSSY